MDDFFKKRLHENNCNYKKSLDRIIDKYSKLHHLDEGLDVDLSTIKNGTLERYMNLARAKLNKLESESVSDLSEESVRALDVTGNSQQLDSINPHDGFDKTGVSLSQIFSDNDDGMSKSDTTQLTGSSLDGSEQNLSERDHLPEDLDQELEQSLTHQGSSFVELYPSMISRIGRALHRKNVSQTADSVLRRYHKWLQQANKSIISNTSVTLKRTSSKPRIRRGRSLEKSQVIRTESASRSPFQLSTNLHSFQGQQPCPESKRGSLRREQHKPIVAMDLSGQFETSEPKEASLNQTFTVSESLELGEDPCTYGASSSWSYYPTAKTSVDHSLRFKRFSVSGYTEQAAGCSTYAPEVTPIQDGSDIYSSPVRQSPKKRRMSGLMISPSAFSRSPKDYVERFSRESPRPRSHYAALSSPPQKLLRIRHLHNTHLTSPSQLQSPQPATAGRVRPKRHLSFDSSLLSNYISLSPKKLDEDITNLYHKFICQNKSSPFNAFPCRHCARAPEASRGHSSALAALALSPHRSFLRKRYRELGCDDHPLSKRPRDEYCTSSPGSKRYGNELLRRRLSHGDNSSSKHSLFNSFKSQQHSMCVQQAARMRRGQVVAAAEFSGLGCSLESSIASGYSQEKKW